MTRQEANREILRRIEQMINACPDLRFGQILRNLDIILENRSGDGMPKWVNTFYEEPQNTLKRMNGE